jgi:hypothetical protein
LFSPNVVGQQIAENEMNEAYDMYVEKEKCTQEFDGYT